MALATPWSVRANHKRGRPGRNAAKKRCRREKRKARKKEASPPIEVAKPPEQERETGGWKRECGGQPGQIVDTEADSPSDHRQGDVQDRKIGRHHEVRAEKKHHDQPLPSRYLRSFVSTLADDFRRCHEQISLNLI
jgi:hypothetical protein